MTLNLNHDTSLDLFNINEHDYEHENDLHSSEDLYDESFSLDLQSHTANIFGYSNEGKQSSNQSSGFADPFFETPSGYGHHVLNTISESAEHQFHTTAQPQVNLTYPPPNFYAPHEPAFAYSLPKRPYLQAHPAAPKQYRSFSAPVQLPSANPFLRDSAPVLGKANTPSAPSASPTDCSVCLASYPPSLAVLQPCAHPLCSACLTSALNIVGEKDMQCAVCNRKVADFKLVSIRKPAGEGLSIPHHPSPLAASPVIAKSFGGGPDFGNLPSQDLDGAFDFGFDPSDIRASTPKLEHQASRGVTASGSQSVVLRIDNVPWVGPILTRRGPRY